MSAYLIAKANTDNEYTDEEFDPFYFILEINQVLLDELQDAIDLAKKTKFQNNNFFEMILDDTTSGIWALHSESLSELLGDEEYIFVREAPEYEEAEMVRGAKMVVDHRENVRFTCYQKYSGDHFETVDIWLDTLREELEKFST